MSSIGDGPGRPGAVVVEPGVTGVAPVVAHHPHLAGRDGDVEAGLAAAGGVARLDVGLGDRDAVDRQLAVLVATDHVVAGQADHSLDEVVVGVVRNQADELEDAPDGLAGAALARLRNRAEPVPGVPEDDDVAAAEVERTGRQLADDDAVVADQGVLHGPGRDVERLDQPGLDDERQHQRHDGDDEDLLDAAPDVLQERPRVVVVLIVVVTDVAGGPVGVDLLDGASTTWVHRLARLRRLGTPGRGDAAEPLFGGLVGHARPSGRAGAWAVSATNVVGEVTDQLRQAMGRWTPDRDPRESRVGRAASIAP